MAVSALTPALNHGCLHDHSGQIMGNDVCVQLFISIFFQITFTEDLASVRHQTRQLDTPIQSRESLLTQTQSIPRTFQNVWPLYTLPMSNRNHLCLVYKPGIFKEGGEAGNAKNERTEARSLVGFEVLGEI